MSTKTVSAKAPTTIQIKRAQRSAAPRLAAKLGQLLLNRPVVFSTAEYAQLLFLV